MQITFRLKGFLKIAIFFAVIVPSVLYFAYKAFRYIRYEAVIYWNTNPVFKYKFETHDSLTKGFLLLTPSLPNNLTYGRLVIIDMQGHLLLEKPVNGVVSDFRQWKINGVTRYTYQVYDSSASQVLAQSGSARHVVIMDSTLKEIKQVHLLPFKDVVTDKKQDLDHHDFIMPGDDHYFTMANYPKYVDNIPAFLPQAEKVLVAAPIIQEIVNGTVVWQWDGSKFPEIYTNSSVGNKFYDTTGVHDYAHMNSIFFDPRDSNLIVSFHNTNQVIKIRHKTGEILWRLGGRNSDFPLTADQVFLRQHHATIVDSSHTLLILDNGEKPARSHSRVLEFKLDEQKKTIESFKQYTIPEPLAGSRGSIQKIGDNYLICGGAANYVLLVDGKTGAKKMELKSNQPLYRAWFVSDITGIVLDKKLKK
jgi:arylsulfate sulfotransferase